MLDMDDSELNETDGIKAFRTGLIACVAVQDRWASLHVDRILGRGDVASQEAADQIAMNFGKGLRRYLESIPPERRLPLSGEVFRGVFYAWMSANMKWDPSRIRPMVVFEDERT